MGFYAEVIRLIESSEEQLSVSDLNIGDVLASLAGSVEIGDLRELPKSSCAAVDIVNRLNSLLEHCESIAKKSRSINEMLNDGHEEEPVIKAKTYQPINSL